MEYILKQCFYIWQDILFDAYKFWNYTNRKQSSWSNIEEQDQSSDIEQQPPFGDRKYSNTQPQNKGEGVTKPTKVSPWPSVCLSPCPSNCMHVRFLSGP